MADNAILDVENRHSGIPALRGQPNWPLTWGVIRRSRRGWWCRCSC